MFLSRTFRNVSFLAVMCSAAAAQSSNSSAQAAPQNQNQQQQSDSSQRVFGVVPQFLVTSDSNPAPLTSRQKFKLFEKTSLDPFTFVSSGFQAALSQASDEFPQYGQGASGYAKRYGATFADQVSSNFFANFLYPVLLKEDPRYFRLGRGSVKRRIMYSLTQEFVARRDNGARTFAFENVLGAFTSGTVSNAYYPSNDRGVRLTVSRSVIAMLYGSVGGIFSEFSPDIQRKLFQRKSKQRTSPERNPYASGSSVRQCHP